MREGIGRALDLVGRAWLARAAVVFVLGVAWSYATVTLLERTQLWFEADVSGDLNVNGASSDLDVSATPYRGAAHPTQRPTHLGGRITPAAG